MFKENYKKVNDNIHLNEEERKELLTEISARIGAKEQKQGRVSGFSKKFGPVIACVLCICVLGAVVLSIVESKHEPLKDSLKKAPNNAQMASVVKNYDEIFEKISSVEFRGTDMYGMAMQESGIPTKGEVQENDLEGSSMKSDKEYSDTNVQVEGVDEADVIKTDGDYIYAMNYEKGIDIYKADGHNTKHIDTVSIDFDKEAEDGHSTGYEYREMYLADDMLIVIVNRFDYYVGEEDNELESNLYRCFFNVSSSTSMYMFDVDKPESAKLVKTYTQDGHYMNSRFTDGALYMITNYSIYETNVKPSKKNPETFVPATYTGDEKTLVAPEDIVVLDDESHYNYSLITKVTEEGFASQLAILGHIENLYASGNNILAYANEYENEEIKIKVADDGSYEKLPEDAKSNTYVNEGSTKTKLYLIGLGNEELKLDATATIDGYVNNQFSIDEYDSSFRVFTTKIDSTNIYTEYTAEEGEDSIAEDSIASLEANSYKETVESVLYVFDEKLNELGKIEHIAKDEHIKSARFMGEVAYVVTFRQTDPLFSIDLSDKQNPKIVGALKIPGFSEYLQSYGTGLLFGFGSAADIEDGGVYGVKLSMFDVSDPKDVDEIAYKELRGSWSSASYNHKAILADAKKNIIGFPSYDAYMIYTYKDGKFISLGKIKDTGVSYDARGLYIDDYYYVIDTYSRTMQILDLTNYTLVKTVNAE